MSDQWLDSIGGLIFVLTVTFFVFSPDLYEMWMTWTK
jgi:hypothetical protein